MFYFYDLLLERVIVNNKKETGGESNEFYNTGSIEGEMRRKYLLKRIAQGDPGSFEELYNEFIGKVYGYLKARLEDEFMVKDLVQETFIAVWRNSSQYNGNSSVSVWVIGIARNKMMDILREKYRRNEDSTAFEDNIENGDGDFTEQSVDGMALRDALETLSAEAKELVYLVFNLGMSYKEAAEAAGIPEGTVKSRMFAIRMSIRKKLGEGGI